MSAHDYEAQSRELASLQKRHYEVQAQNMQLEISSRQASDMAEDSRAVTERLRNETALLRAENALWKVGLLALMALCDVVSLSNFQLSHS